MPHKLIQLSLCLLAGCTPVQGSSPGQSRSRSSIVPDEVLAVQHAQDREILRALANAGSDLSRPHEIEHHFLCATPAAAEPVLAWARGAGYTPSLVREDVYQGQRYAYFDLVASTIPTSANINRQTTAMQEIAAKHGMQYDGWGCAVVN